MSNARDLEDAELAARAEAHLADEFKRERDAARAAQKQLADALAAARTDNERLREELRNALEGMEDMRGYVSDYFAEKWGHDEYIARVKAAIKTEEKKS